MDSFMNLSGRGLICRFALVYCTLISLHMCFSLPTNSVTMVRNNNCYNINVRHDSQMYASPSDDEYDERRKDLDRKIREMEEQQQKMAEMMKLMSSREATQLRSRIVSTGTKNTKSKICDGSPSIFSTAQGDDIR